MIYTVYLNPTIDEMIYLKEFRLGKTNRPDRIVQDGAGKGINVSVVLKELGQEVKCIGFSHADGGIISQRLESCLIPYDFIKIPGKTRVNIKIFDENTKTVTEINEPGSRVDPKNLDAVTNKILNAAKDNDMVILTGSLPEGCEPSFYAELIEKLNSKGVRCILDADGEALRLGIAAKPCLIKPNRDELCGLYGMKDPSLDEIAELAMKTALGGIQYVMVSLGNQGALIADSEEVLFAQAPKVEVLSTVGAGDSMLAAVACSLDKNMETALKSGVAAAAASIIREGTKLMKNDDYKRFFATIQVKKIC